MDFKSLVSPAKWKERFALYRRTIDVARKPDKEEFMSAAKITALGIALLGAIGFLIFLAYELSLGQMILEGAGEFGGAAAGGV